MADQVKCQARREVDLECQACFGCGLPMTTAARVKVQRDSERCCLASTPPNLTYFGEPTLLKAFAAVANVATLSSPNCWNNLAYLEQRHGSDGPHQQPPFDSDTRNVLRPDRPSLTEEEKNLGFFGRERVQEKLTRGFRAKKKFKRIMAAVAHPTRPLGRRNSPLSVFSASQGFSTDAPRMKRIEVDDDSDSDDEPPPAIKFSKVTQALLDDVDVQFSPSKQNQLGDVPHLSNSTTARPGLDTPSRANGIRIVRRSSPSAPGSQSQPERGHTPPRVVHLSTTKPTGSAAKRSISVSGPYSQSFVGRREPTPDAVAKPEVVTPAQATRAVRVTRSGTGSRASQDEPVNGISSVSRPESRNGRSAPDTNERKNGRDELNRSTSQHNGPETRSRLGASTTARSRNTSADAAAAPPPGSQRIKRAPIGTGSFLKSGPVRRGFRRRDSEENVSPNDEWQSGSASQPNQGSFTPQERSMVHTDGVRSRSGSVNARATSVEPVSVHDFAPQGNALNGSRPSSRQGNSYLSRSQMSNDSRPPSRQGNLDPPRSRQHSVERHQPQRRISTHLADAPKQSQSQASQRRPSIDSVQARPALEQKVPQRVPSLGRTTYRYAAPKLQTDALEDQENVPPPTFKRNKDQEFKYLGKPSVAIMSDDEKPKSKAEETPVPVPHQEQRKALGTISNNTPHRAAPAPPPKMTVLDTATTTGGASTTKARKKRQHMVVNGKIFTQMGKIGKGGSSDVYCVMAENYKTFALKRVKLDDCDENAVRGYKGEIDLLKKLTEVERVVRLFDWELNEEKQELIVLMEKGDTDLNRILTLRLNGADAQFDSAFTRYHWKEMLECVEAVHEYDIVHSDLKPANFLLVQGRLKLIDFGIANAIDIDNTCNVHRDSHVGTPNYMSPESITDTNASQPGKDNAGRSAKKDMRIGKSSDVWSLGCILYQMAYGRPPFAHISNQISRIMAITNPKHIIEFPEIGVGGVTIPPALRGTLRKCLNRDPDQRPTIRQMLDISDPFLYPEGSGPGMVLISEELLGQIITKVVDRCKDPKRGIPTSDEVQQYPGSFMAKIREMQENR